MMTKKTRIVGEPMTVRASQEKVGKRRVEKQAEGKPSKNWSRNQRGNKGLPSRDKG